MIRRFTGYHMAAIVVGFFMVVIAVNFVMARSAVRTFGGTVVENSYVASQQYNRWLQEAREQKALGWTLDVSADKARHLVVGTHAPGGPLQGATVAVTATHPLGLADPLTLRFAETEAGRFRATAPLPAGRWLIRIEVRQGANDAFFDDEVPA